MKRFNLIGAVYRGINSLEESFITKYHPEYKSNLSKSILIETALVFFVSLLGGLLGSILSLSPENGANGLYIIVFLPYVCCVIYWIFYLRRHLHLLPTNGQKIGYGLFTCVFLVLLGPSIFPMLIALILLSIAIQIALFLLSVVTTIIALFDSGSKKKRFSLDNGEKVTEKTGLFGEKYYDGDSGKSYETNDNGRTFYEK